MKLITFLNFSIENNILFLPNTHMIGKICNFPLSTNLGIIRFSNQICKHFQIVGPSQKIQLVCEINFGNNWKISDKTSDQYFVNNLIRQLDKGHLIIISGRMLIMLVSCLHNGLSDDPNHDYVVKYYQVHCPKNQSSFDFHIVC